MDEDPDFLDKLAADIADGGSIDWDRLQQLPSDSHLRRLLEHLRVVSEIAEQHRSAADEPVDLATTGPLAGLGPRIGHVRESATDGEPGIGRWGHLLLRRRIGEGAFGEVFHAHDLWLDHPVALKLLKPEIAQSDFSARILHEARRLARVRHPNVVAVHGADMHEGRIGFWMDLVEGHTLADLVSRGRMSPGEAAHIGRELCLALAAVHGANLIHRDIKAQNVMRASNGGRIILMDFGAGEFMDRPSADARMRGTPLYLAPELFDNAPASVATDIYAAGVLLFYLVTGSYPMTAASMDALTDAHRRGERRRLRDVRPDLPNGFITAVERAIERDPKRRFASAGEMYEALGGESETGATLTTRERVLRGVAVVGALLTFTEALGLLASRAFEGALRIDPEFTAGVLDYFAVGRRALLPFLLVWAAAGAAAAVLVGLRPLLWPYLGPIGRYLSALNERIEPATQAGLLVCFGIAGFLWLTWQFWDVYNVLTALALDSRPEAVDLSILDWPGRPLHRLHSQVSVALSFLMGVAVWRWFPRLERRAADPARVRGLRWAAVVLMFLIVAEETVTRPFIWDRREVVAFGEQRASVIGSSEDELLLFTPEPGQRKFFRVPANDPQLRRNVDARPLFLGPASKQ